MTTKTKVLIVVAVLVGTGIGFFAGYEVEREHIVHALTSGLTQAGKEVQKETTGYGKEKAWTDAEVKALETKVLSEKTPPLTVKQANCSTEHLIARYTPTELVAFYAQPEAKVVGEIKGACGIERKFYEEVKKGEEEDKKTEAEEGHAPTPNGPGYHANATCPNEEGKLTPCEVAPSACTTSGIVCYNPNQTPCQVKSCVKTQVQREAWTAKSEEAR